MLAKNYKEKIMPFMSGKTIGEVNMVLDIVRSSPDCATAMRRISSSYQLRSISGVLTPVLHEVYGGV